MGRATAGQAAFRRHGNGSCKVVPQSYYSAVPALRGHTIIFYSQGAKEMLLGHLVHAMCQQIGFDLVRKPKSLLRRSNAELHCTLEMVASHYAMTAAECLIMQVGSFDGTSNDPINRIIKTYRWPAVLIEPQVKAFEQLTATYGSHENTIIKNVAIADIDGFRNLYCIRPGTPGPPWLGQLASFNRNVILKHKKWIPDIASMIEVMQVRCITFDTLFNEIGRRRADILQIDAEGYDYQLIKHYDIKRRRPAIVQFEHAHLSRHEWDECVSLFIQLGYAIACSDRDTIACAY